MTSQSDKVDPPRSATPHGLTYMRTNPSIEPYRHLDVYRNDAPSAWAEVWTCTWATLSSIIAPGADLEGFHVCMYSSDRLIKT